MAEFIVKKAVKEEVNKKGMLCASDAFDAINKYVQKLIDNGIANAQKNKRKTVKAEDFTM
jgi:histone H3/H4